jgi:hypothetical protein
MFFIITYPIRLILVAKYATTAIMKKRSGDDDQNLDTSTTSEIGASRLLKAQKSPKAPQEPQA